jgi:hypothetical protein
VNTKLVNDDVFFLRFKLKDREGALKDENFYWLAKAGKSYEKLNELKPVELQIEIDQNAAQISNPSGETAFFIRLKLVDEKSGELVLPVFMSDNYITLLSGEKKKITIDRSLLPELVKGKSILLVAEGWNAMPKSVKID